MTNAIQQDTELPVDAVERAARIATDDLIALYKGTSQAAFVHDDDGLSSVHIDGKIDMRRLIRVVSAALKTKE
jgi:hypothetical protein